MLLNSVWNVPLYMCVCLKQKTHEMTNGAESHVGTQISLNGLAKSGGEVSPDTDKLKEAGKKTPPSNALNDKRTEQPW